MSQSGYLAVLYQALVKYDKVYEGNESEWIPCGVIPSSGLVWQIYSENRCPLLGIRCMFGKDSVHSYITNGASPPLGGECKEYSSFPNRALDDADNIDSRSQYYEPTSSD